MKISNDNKVLFYKSAKIPKDRTDDEYQEQFTESEELHKVAKQIISRTDREIQVINFEKTNIKMGQKSIEESLMIHLIQMIYTAIILYLFLDYFAGILVYLYLISGMIDIIILSFLIFFSLKFRNSEAFCNIPRNVFNTCEFINFIGLLLKSFNVSLIYSYTTKHKFSLYVSFAIKYLIDLYFCIMSLKMFKFCKFTIWLNHKVFSFFRWLKNLVFCYKEEDKITEEEEVFKKNEVLESNY